MTKITENAIKTFCVELLEKQGYEYIYAPDISPSGVAWISVAQSNSGKAR